MKIHENFHVKDKFIMIKVSKYLKKVSKYLVSMFFRFVELCSARNQCIYFQVILCFYLFLIQNI